MPEVTPWTALTARGSATGTGHRDAEAPNGCVDVIRLTAVDPRIAAEALEGGQILVGGREDVDRLLEQLEPARRRREASIRRRIGRAERRIERACNVVSTVEDRERARELLADIERLREKRGVSRDRNESDADLQDIVERRLEKAAQTCIDLGRLVGRLEGRDLGDSTNTEVLVSLVEMGILPRSHRQEFIDIGGLRNVLAHRYRRIDNSGLYEVYHDLERLERFSEAVHVYLDGGNG